MTPEHEERYKYLQRSLVLANRRAKMLVDEAKRDLREFCEDLRRETRERPLTPADLVYSAKARCPCGAGLAMLDIPDGVGSWQCSGLLLRTAELGQDHIQSLPHGLSDIMSERHKKARKKTTRPAPPEEARPADRN